MATKKRLLSPHGAHVEIIYFGTGGVQLTSASIFSERFFFFEIVEDIRQGMYIGVLPGISHIYMPKYLLVISDAHPGQYGIIENGQSRGLD